MLEDSNDKTSSTESDIEALRREVVNNSNLIKEIVHLHRRLTDNFQEMVNLDNKVSDVAESVLAMQQQLSRQQSTIEILMTWHNNQKAVRSAFGWLIDKAPTLAGVAVVLFWVIDQWQSKKGGGS